MVTGAAAAAASFHWRGAHGYFAPEEEVWVQTCDGAIFGLFLGLMIGGRVVTVLRRFGAVRDGVEWRVFGTAAALWGLPGLLLLPGLLRPVPDSAAGARMYLTEWAAAWVLPAYGFAMCLALYATVCGRTPRQHVMAIVGRSVLGLGGLMLLVLPLMAGSAESPSRGEGPGEIEAIVLVWGVGWSLVCVALASLMRAGRRWERARTARYMAAG